MADPLLPGVDLGLVLQQLFGGGFFVRQGDIPVSARAAKHPTATPATSPADQPGILDGLISDAKTHLGFSLRGDGCGGTRPGTAEAAGLRIAHLLPQHGVRLKGGVGDDAGQLLPRAELWRDQHAEPAQPPQTAGHGHVLVREVARTAGVLLGRSEQVRDIGRDRIGQESPLLEKRLWKIGGSRLAENLLGAVEPYSQWRQNQLRTLLSKGEVFEMDEHPDLDLKDKVVILLVGKAIHTTDKQKEYKAPALIEQPDQIEFAAGSRIFVC